MILSSTVRKLAEKWATIYRVDVPAHTVTMGENSHEVPAYREWFATMGQAEKRADTFREFAAFGVPEPTITPELCTMEAHYLNT
jgi:hypothetical protein